MNFKKEFLEFVDEFASAGCVIILKRRIAINKWQIIDRYELLDRDFKSAVKFIHAKALEDFEKQKTATYCLTIRTKNQSRSRTFHSSPLNKNPCKDCRGSMWYVGLVEKKKCPTCKGSGVENG